MHTVRSDWFGRVLYIPVQDYETGDRAEKNEVKRQQQRESLMFDVL